MQEVENKNNSLNAEIEKLKGQMQTLSKESREQVQKITTDMKQSNDKAMADKEKLQKALRDKEGKLQELKDKVDEQLRYIAELEERQNQALAKKSKKSQPLECMQCLKKDMEIQTISS